MIGYIVVFIAWSLVMIGLGMYFDDRLNDSYIGRLERSRDFQKAQKERFVEEIKPTIKENHSLRKMNDQLIQENKKLKKELDKQSNTTYNIFY